MGNGEQRPRLPSASRLNNIESSNQIARASETIMMTNTGQTDTFKNRSAQ
jgi:hypothetical protein